MKKLIGGQGELLKSEIPNPLSIKNLELQSEVKTVTVTYSKTFPYIQELKMNLSILSNI